MNKNFSTKQWTIHNDENKGLGGATAAAAGRLRADGKRGALGEIGNTINTKAADIIGKAGTTTASTASTADLKRALSSHSLYGNAAGRDFGAQQAQQGAMMQISPMKGTSFDSSDALDIDAADQHDQFACTEYTMDIDRHLRHAEGRYMVSPNYMSSQTEITEKMRGILIDWLVEVHLKFKLRHETLFLAINILDRFLEKHAIARNRLQLVGVVSLMVAAKYEEIYPPVVHDYVYICDNAYTRSQILQMEPIILNLLGFRFTVATPYTFLQRFCKAAAGREGDTKLYNAASYILEHSLLDYSMIKNLPSITVAAAISIALKMLGRPSWSPTLTKYTRYTESSLRPVIDELLAVMRKTAEGNLKAVNKKYCSAKFDSVATLPIPTM